MTCGQGQRTGAVKAGIEEDVDRVAAHAAKAERELLPEDAGGAVGGRERVAGPGGSWPARVARSGAGFAIGKEKVLVHRDRWRRAR